jgi:D-amino-acid dehydrogenase
MRVVVLGAGVVGVTTAYYLSQLGCEVTVVDRAGEPGDGASFGNAGQLSYSFTDALAKPAFIAHLPSMLLGRDRGSMVRLSPGLIHWGLRFLAQCTASRARENTLAVLQLAMRSAGLMAELQESLPFDFAHRTAGKLVLLSSTHEVEAAKASSAMKQPHGCDARVLSRDEAIDIEPAIAEMSDEIIGAVYSASDEVADSQLFATGLRDWLDGQGAADFRLSSEARRLLMHNGRACGVVADGDEIEADAVVVCLGAWSQGFLRETGVNPHIEPVRGYSITLPPGPVAPKVSVTALKYKMVYSRLNGSLRIAGFADFAGFDTAADAERIQLLSRVAQQFAPQAADYSVADTRGWGGFRPMTPNGRPLVGPTKVPGLYVNVGHGMLGWTLACATAHDAAQAIADLR